MIVTKSSFQALPLPGYFVDRPGVSQDLKKRLLSNSETLVFSAIYGSEGIGKTFLAQALAHDPEVQEHFCDGILWVTLGKQPNLLSLLQDWIVSLDDCNFQLTNVKAASIHLKSLLSNKAILLVIDDAWNIEDIKPFLVGGDKCQVMITTRRADIAEKANARPFSLGVMSESRSLILLSNRIDRDLKKQEQESAKQLAATVGYLPIALDLAAAMVNREKSWLEINTALTAEIERLEALNSIDRSNCSSIYLEASLNISLNLLQENFPEAWSSFIWLGILAEGVSVAAPMVATLWGVDITIVSYLVPFFTIKMVLIAFY